jgi:hypothetical protein
MLQNEQTDALAFRRLTLEIAAETDADVRTVSRRLRGLPVRGPVGGRIDRAIAKRRSADAA